MLADVLPCNDATFSMPLREGGRYRQVIIEGSNTYDVEPFLEIVVAHTPREPLFGRWMLFDKDDCNDGLKLLYDPMGEKMNTLQLLVFMLRKHLIQVGRLYLQPVSQLHAVRNGREVLKQAVPLPPEIGNGCVLLQNPVFRPTIVR